MKQVMEQVVIESENLKSRHETELDDLRFVDGHDSEWLDSTFFAEAGSWEWYPNDEDWDRHDNYGA